MGIVCLVVSVGAVLVSIPPITPSNPDVMFIIAVSKTWFGSTLKTRQYDNDERPRVALNARAVITTKMIPLFVSGGLASSAI